MGIDDIAYMSAAEIAAHVRRRTLSPVEIVDSCIARIERRNPSLNAFVFKGFDDARREAKAAEQAVMAGAATRAAARRSLRDQGPVRFQAGLALHLRRREGDEGLRRAMALRLRRKRVEKAGAILLGKTNSPTMGLRGTCDNYLFGPSRNPFDTGKNTGGSSGGSAAAVADGLVPFAEGTDAGGSIRIPAAWCNVVGFKASFGQRSRRHAAERLSPAIRPSSSKGRSRAPWRTPPSSSTSLSGYDSRDPFSHRHE